MSSPSNSELLASNKLGFLLVSFGGPEAPDEVVPFLERVTAGRGIPAERLRVVGEHYFARGGVSPINQQCRDLIDELRPALASDGLDLPVYWGNRNAPPFLEDTVATMRDDGIEHAIAFVTSAYSSYSGCRQYRENLGAAIEAAGPGAPSVHKLRVYFNHPGFIDPMADGLAAVVSKHAGKRLRVFFTAHSIPTSMAASSEYAHQVENAAALVVDRSGADVDWSVAWQSRSGPPSMPWLEPDIVDAIRGLDAVDADTVVVVVPVGFVSDHMEVIQDLDTDAAAAAEQAGYAFERVSTSSTDRRFVSMIVELVREQLDAATPVALGSLGLVADQCNAQCCPAPQRPSSTQGGGRPTP